MVWGMWAIRDPNCRAEVLICPIGASGLNAGGREGDLIEHLWPRYAAPLPPAAFSQPPSDIRSGSENSEGRRWLVEGRVGGVRAGWGTAVTLLRPGPCIISANWEKRLLNSGSAC